MTPVLAISERWLTPAWAVQAVVMVWIASKMNSTFMRRLGELLLICVVVRLATVDLPHFYGAHETAKPWLDYLPRLAERVIALGTPIAALAMCYWISYKQQPASLPRNSSHDLQAGTFCQFATFAALILVTNLEAYHTAHWFDPQWCPTSITLVWAMAFSCVIAARSIAAPAFRYTCLIALGVALVVKYLCWDMQLWRISPQFCYELSDSMAYAGLRWFDLMVIVATVAIGQWSVSREKAIPDTPTIAAFLGGISFGLLLLVSTLEVNTYFYFQFPELRYGAISILWASYALGLLLAGMQWRHHAWRYLGLGLFAIVILKVFLLDLAQLDTFYRIIAFLILGVLTIAGSYLYLRYQEMFTAATDNPLVTEGTPS